MSQPPPPRNPSAPNAPYGPAFHGLDELIKANLARTHPPNAPAQPAPNSFVKRPSNPLRRVRAVVIFFLVISLAAVVNFTATAAWDVTRHDDRATIPALIAVACLLSTLLCLWGIRKLNARLRDHVRSRGSIR